MPYARAAAKALPEPLQAGIAVAHHRFAAQTRAQKLLAAAIGLTGVCIAMGGIQWYSLLALPLLALYRGQRGTYRLKYLFYAYYPIHLMILEGVRIARRR